jgi:hypothetical protein
MAAAKRVKLIGAEPDKSSPEDEKELERLLRILGGKGRVSDWERLVGKEDGRSSR